jgi:hypothetical protein
VKRVPFRILFLLETKNIKFIFASFRVHFSFFEVKQVKQDSFCMRFASRSQKNKNIFSLLFASNFSPQMKGNKKGHNFWLYFASISFTFASYFPVLPLSIKLTKFFASYFHFLLISERHSPFLAYQSGVS